MKVLLLLFAVLGIAAVKAVPVRNALLRARSLEDDFADFWALIPTDEVRAIIDDHMANDAELQEVIAFVKSDDFKQTLLALEAIPEYITFLDYMYNSGLDVYYYINWVHNVIGLPEITPPSETEAHKPNKRSLTSMLDEIMAILPEEELEALSQEKLQTSPEYKEMYDRMSSPDFMVIVLNLLSVSEYRELKQHLLDNGIDIDQLLELLHAFLGLPWRGSFLDNSARIHSHLPADQKSQRTLEDDFADFWALIPKEEVHAIVDDHLANDAELRESIDFVKSEDFKETLQAIEAIPEYIAFLNYMYKYGLDVYYYINWVHDLIGIPELTPPTDAKAHKVQKRSLSTMVDEIIAILPEEELEALCQEKLETSPEFKAMYDSMSSPEFIQIVLDLLAVPEYLELKQHLLDNGIDVNELNRLFHAFIGLPNI